MIVLNELEKLYNKKTAAPKGLLPTTLSIEDSSIVALLGENGAGKTTLLRILAGQLLKGGGEVLIDGKAPEQSLEKISFITGDGSYFMDMKICEYGEYLNDFNPNFSLTRYVKLCNFFELNYLDKINRLSTGQRARVELAAGFAKQASVYLMDEPFLGKDVFTRLDFIKLMSGALRGNETILISTHYVDEIENFAERALIMHKGQIVADVQIEQLHENGLTLVDQMAQSVGWQKDRIISLDD